MAMIKGYKHTKEAIEKIRAASTGRRKSEDELKKMRGENNPNWGGDTPKTKGAIHKRIEKILGKPSFCEICKCTTKKMYEWSNKHHTYLLKLDDWQRLCCSCHRKYDLEKFGPTEKQVQRWKSMIGVKRKPHTEETKRKMSISAKLRINV